MQNRTKLNNALFQIPFLVKKGDITHVHILFEKMFGSSYVNTEFLTSVFQVTELTLAGNWHWNTFLYNYIFKN